jgi:hypothetical protein
MIETRLLPKLRLLITNSHVIESRVLICEELKQQCSAGKEGVSNIDAI